MTKNKWIRLFVFVYVLFLPVAFTSWGGLRIYRNTIIAPAIILTFSLLLLGLVNIVREEKIKKTVWLAILAGLVFAFTYYLKEDGIWMMACLAVLLIIELGIVFCKIRKEKTKQKTKKTLKWVTICLIPFFVWFAWTNIYKGVNHAFFGVYETNTRTKGELGKFVEKIYKIDDEGRTDIIWAPVGAIKKAFEVSPTLGSHPELLEEIMTTGFQSGDILKDPIRYDFLTWILRSELADAGLWTSEEDVSNMFKQINAELDEAFSNGTLKKAEGRIQLLASTGGYTIEEIKNSDILQQILMTLEDSVWYTRFDVGFGEEDVAYGTKRGENNIKLVNKVLHMEGDVNVVDRPGRQEAKTVVRVMTWMYRIVNIIVVVIMVGSYLYCIVSIIRNRKKLGKFIAENRVWLSCTLASFLFLGVTIVYSFATAWFFIAPFGKNVHSASVFTFYRVGVYGLFVLALLPAAIGASLWFAKKRKVKNESVTKRNS